MSWSTEGTALWEASLASLGGTGNAASSSDPPPTPD